MARIIDTQTLRELDLNADEVHWCYNGLDASITHEIFHTLYNLVDDTAKRTYEFSKALQAPVAEMCLRGILVNQNKRRKVLTEMRAKLEQLEAQFQRIVQEGVGVPYVNWRSPAQLNQLLYGVMGLPVQKNRKADGSYGPATDRDALEKLSIYFIAEPICNHLLAMRDLGKSIGFLETEIDPDGRMRSDLKIAGTVTGRFASSVTEFGSGTNLQNVTESLRSVFVSDPGYKLANLDLEQGDSRNVGAICWNLLVDNSDWDERTAGAYLNACESGDLHTTVARMTLPFLPWGTASDRTIAETPFYRHFDYRFMCKRLGHGSNYLGQPPKMAKETKFPLQSVKDFQTNYFNAFPCITAWHQSVFSQLVNLGFIETLFGDRRYFFGRPKEGSTQRDAVAHAPQSMTAKEINTGILNLWRANKVQLLMQVHDSILFQFPEEQENEIIPWALEQLKVPLTLKKDRQFHVPVEAQVGWNWGKLVLWTKEDFLNGLCKESDIGQCKENPDGLVKWKGTDSRKRTEKDFRLSLKSL